MISSLVIMLGSVFIAACSQVLLKISASRKYKSKKEEILNPRVIGAYSIFLISMIMSTVSLRGIDLKLAPIIETTGYIYILVLSHIIIKEPITKHKILGSSIIIIGVIIFNL